MVFVTTIDTFNGYWWKISYDFRFFHAITNWAFIMHFEITPEIL